MDFDDLLLFESWPLPWDIIFIIELISKMFHQKIT